MEDPRNIEVSKLGGCFCQHDDVQFRLEFLILR